MNLTMVMYDKNGASQGQVRVHLDFSGQKWSVVEDLRKVWSRVGVSSSGAIDVNGQKVGIKSQPPGKPPQVVLILDSISNAISSPAGTGNIVGSADPSFSDGKVFWIRNPPTLSPIRQKALNILNSLGAVAEPPNFLVKTPKVKDASGATGCGAFPGWLIKQLGAEQFISDTVPHRFFWKTDPETKKPLYQSVTLEVTKDMTAWEAFALKVEKAPGTVWIPYKPGDARRPLAGDIYLLMYGESSVAPDGKTRVGKGDFRHVGVIVSASGNTWRTADGGQGKGFAAGTQERQFDPASGRLGGTADSGVLKGWVDLEGLLKARPSG